MRSSKKMSIVLTLLAAVGLFASTASAETLQAFATRSGNDTNTTTGVFAPLDQIGNTSLPFATTAANKVVKITYNAECGVQGPLGSWQSVTVLVDGVEASPASNTQFAFCTSDGTGSFNWKGAVRQSFIKVPVKGAHKLQIRVDLNFGATNWWLGDSSTAVEQQ